MGNVRSAWTTLSLLLLLYMVAFLDRQALLLMVDPVRHSLNLDDVQIGLLQGPAFASIYALAGFPLGYLADRYPRRPIIVAAVLIWGMATVACGLARSFGELFVARSFVGFGEAGLVPAAHAMIASLFPADRRTLPFAIFQSGAIVGVGASLLLSGLLVQYLGGGAILPIVGRLEGWQLVFVAIGLPTMWIGLTILLVPEPPRGSDERRSATDSRSVFRFVADQPRLFGCLFGGFALVAAINYGVMGWLPAYLGRTASWLPAQIGGALAAVNIVGGLAGCLGIGAIVTVLFRRGMIDAHLRYYALATPVAGVLAIVGFHVGAPVLLLVLLTVAGTLSWMPIIAIGGAALQTVVPDQYRGRMAALFLGTANLVGLGVGPTAVGMISERHSASGSGLGFAIICLIAVLTPLATVCFAFGMSALRTATSLAQGEPRR